MDTPHLLRDQYATAPLAARDLDFPFYSKEKQPRLLL